ncbi:hypothetical protein DR098_00920 [Mycoplasma hyorhinis]|uniref:Uncharacterized protein n=1 Tax=Mesomycoplasma hyorhinis TaxID=2100 RepID=A0ABD6IDR6_MESHY|nr:hypothetical protein [Mesomycoplasma hyorhinis]MXR08868.1 hypothetical protein [Mesomycoplasma hyorhinis]MXR11408.1 hypothetical protein [Mesomycoplasma hyorhinis]MXR38542.1 hypothetical protein [Mesomycoplasma hyorhinis]MXR43516.1 hypothetical protein [Mesomycoplasma hyorhinis]
MTLSTKNTSIGCVFLLIKYFLFFISYFFPFFSLIVKNFWIISKNTKKQTKKTKKGDLIWKFINLEK